MPSNSSISAAVSGFATFFAELSPASNEPLKARITHSENDQITIFLISLFLKAIVEWSYLTKCCPKDKRYEPLPQEFEPFTDPH
jgi:hypothetical protein